MLTFTLTRKLIAKLEPKLPANEFNPLENVIYIVDIGISLIKIQTSMIENIAIKYGRCYKVIYMSTVHLVILLGYCSVCWDVMILGLWRNVWLGFCQKFVTRDNLLSPRNNQNKSNQISNN